MATQLTQVSQAVRQYGLTVLFSIIGVFVVWNLGKIGYQACCVQKATPTPRANALYGVLEPLQFAQTPKTSANLKLNLETIDGSIPPLATASAFVYEIQKKTPGLDYADKSLKAAQNVGLYNPLVQQDSDATFLFINPTDQNLRMRYEFTYDNFELKYENYLSYVSLERGSAPSEETALANTIGFLNKVRTDIFKNSRDAAKQVTSNANYYYIEPATGDRTEVPNQLQANVTVLNMNRLPIKGVPVIGPSTTQALMNFIYTGITASSNRNAQIRLLQANVTFWPVITDTNTPASYPLKSPTQAWSELLAGQGYVLNEANTNEEFNVRRIYMAYYEPDKIAKYLHPVWVFEGDKPDDTTFLFRAIVPAVATGYISSVQ